MPRRAATAGGGALAVRRAVVRLKCLSKRPSVDDEPYVLKELALLPLSLAPFVDPASRRADEAPAGLRRPRRRPRRHRAGVAADLLTRPTRRARQLELLRGNFTFESVGIGVSIRSSASCSVACWRRDAAGIGAAAPQFGRGAGRAAPGPPGTGKTLTARKIGGLLKVKEERTHVVNGPDLVSKFLGESEANLRGVFDAARSTSGATARTRRSTRHL